MTPVPSACRSLGPSVRHVCTAGPPPPARCLGGSAATSGGARRDGPAALTRRGRGRSRPAKRSRAHLLAAAVQGPGPWRAALGGFRAELEREVPDRVPGEEPHRPRRRRGLGRLSSGSSAARAGAGRGEGGARAGGAGPWSVGGAEGQCRGRGRGTERAPAGHCQLPALLASHPNSPSFCVLISKM